MTKKELEKKRKSLEKELEKIDREILQIEYPQPIPNLSELEKIKKLIGMNIRQKRKAIFFTQKELAKRAGKSRFWLTAIEIGTNFPTIEGLYHLAIIFNCSISDFFIEEKNIND